MTEFDDPAAGECGDHGQHCLQMIAVGDLVSIRDSKDPHGPALTFSRREIRAFLDGAKGGEFNDLA